jgi:hypothetical protein
MDAHKINQLSEYLWRVRGYGYLLSDLGSITDAPILNFNTGDIIIGGEGDYLPTNYNFIYAALSRDISDYTAYILQFLVFPFKNIQAPS